MYVGHSVTAQVGDAQIEGSVTRVEEEEGVIYAYIDKGSGNEEKVPIENIEIITGGTAP